MRTSTRQSPAARRRPANQRPPLCAAQWFGGFAGLEGRREGRRAGGGGRCASTAAVFGEDAPSGPSHLFRTDISELVVVRLGGEPPDHLVIEAWHEGRGVTRRERR